MALPDTLERIGIVVGSVLLLSLPASALTSLAYGVGRGSPFLPYLWLLPGALVGLLVATDRLAVTYHRLWKFSLASYLVASLGPVVFDTTETALALGWWLVAVGVGILVARYRLRSLFPTPE